ncbi:MAG: 2-C-methyl-D-erythritol 2,4-cyclodiphosphate synthase [Turicibacter sp.]|nr:2-C-methyl-D-erythritol 2,4-cyclodiphosphate synthase [Turicibacter sp.]
MIRIGHSTDIHQLVEGRKLILGGVEIEHTKGLLGHSDADVLCHAVTEAIIGALAKGDIGTHFPDTDSRYKGVDSRILLRATKEMMDEAGYVLGNLDATIYAEYPKMRPHIDAMRHHLATDLGTTINQVNIKATRGEKLGFIGREEGIVAECVVLLFKKNINV